MKDEVMNLLLANGLRYLSDFLILLLKNPQMKMMSEEEVLIKHPFGAAILLACEKSKVSFADVKSWGKQILDHFIVKNFVFLPTHYKEKFKINADEVETPIHWTMSEHIHQQTKQMHDLLQLNLDLLTRSKRMEEKISRLEDIIVRNGLSINSNSTLTTSEDGVVDVSTEVRY